MAVARKFIDKKLLHNVIRNTDAHNKIEEEKVMWRLHRIKNDCDYSKSLPSSRHKNKRINKHKDESSKDTSNTYWMKELTNYENSLSERWGHNGYKELYPDEFKDKTDDSCSDEDSGKKARSKRKKEKVNRKTKDRDSSRRKNAKKKKTSSSDKIRHTERKSKRDRRRLDDKKPVSDSLKVSKRKKKSRKTSTKRKILHDKRTEHVKRQKTEN